MGDSGPNKLFTLPTSLVKRQGLIARPLYMPKVQSVDYAQCHRPPNGQVCSAQSIKVAAKADDGNSLVVKCCPPSAVELATSRRASGKGSWVAYPHAILNRVPPAPSAPSAAPKSSSSGASKYVEPASAPVSPGTQDVLTGELHATLPSEQGCHVAPMSTCVDASGNAVAGGGEIGQWQSVNFTLPRCTNMCGGKPCAYEDDSGCGTSSISGTYCRIQNPTAAQTCTGAPDEDPISLCRAYSNPQCPNVTYTTAYNV
jgi:hypothetical protein